MSKHFWRGNWNGRMPAGHIHERARTIIRPTGGILRGKFPSRKNGRMVHHEGLLELGAIYLFEASPSIVRYREQPRMLQYPDGGRLRKYTPDFELELVDGRVITIEVKPTRSLARADVRQKFESIGAHLQRTGATFVILTEQSIRKEPRLSNLRWLYHRAARTPPSNDAIRRVFLKHSTHFPLSIGAAIQALRNDNVDPFSLILAGKVCCSLDMPIGDETVLNINLETQHEWFRISEEYGF